MNITKIKRIGITAAAIFTFAIPTTVMAAYVGGGIWNYGVGYTGTYGYSNYFHSSQRHYATVKLGTRVSSDYQWAGNWAKSSITKIPPTRMNYYWGFY